MLGDSLAVDRVALELRRALDDLFWNGQANRLLRVVRVREGFGHRVAALLEHAVLDDQMAVHYGNHVTELAVIAGNHFEPFHDNLPFDGWKVRLPTSHLAVTGKDRKSTRLNSNHPSISY